MSALKLNWNEIFEDYNVDNTLNVTKDGEKAYRKGKAMQSDIVSPNLKPIDASSHGLLIPDKSLRPSDINKSEKLANSNLGFFTDKSISVVNLLSNGRLLFITEFLILGSDARHGDSGFEQGGDIITFLLIFALAELLSSVNALAAILSEEDFKYVLDEIVEFEHVSPSIRPLK
uniref:Uncharacterized protein n=1 Tax=Glossina austeni TaxID=7395 RepID=A0A1A9VJA9_GLOAU